MVIKNALQEIFLFYLLVIYWKTSDNSIALENLFNVGIWIAPFQGEPVMNPLWGEITKTKRCTKFNIF